MSRAVTPALAAVASASFALALVASCAEPDDRPLSLEFATEAILAPSCGNAQCHSSFRQAEGFAFDTVEQSRSSIIQFSELVASEDVNGIVISGDTENAMLLTVLTRFPDRMPYDQPLPDNDIDYLRRYIAAGRPGAQCLPDDGVFCAGYLLANCGPDGNISEIVEDCSKRPAPSGFKFICSPGGPECRMDRCSITTDPLCNR